MRKSGQKSERVVVVDDNDAAAKKSNVLIY
jgi:hypothetical protein